MSGHYHRRVRASAFDRSAARDRLRQPPRRFRQVRATGDRIALPIVDVPAAEMTFDEEDDRSQRVPVALVLDTSQTMAGEPLTRLGAILTRFEQALKEDVELSDRLRISVITSGDGLVRAWRGGVVAPFGVSPFVDASSFALPELVAAGNGSMLEAVELAIYCVGEEKAALKRRYLSYYRPLIWVFSDGHPTEADRSDEAWRRLAGQIAAFERQKRFALITVSLGDAPRDDRMRLLAPDAYVRGEGLELEVVLQLVSASVESAAHDDPIEAIKARVMQQFSQSFVHPV
jgi:uncharacterized protein YegL